jgi:ATP phosphoribosyltransferase
MLVDSTRIHIAIQKSGRLSDLSRGLLRDAGLRIQNGKNELTARVENFAADLMFVRDDDIPTFVSDGICEFGIVGENVLQEYSPGSASAAAACASRRPKRRTIAAPNRCAVPASPPPIPASSGSSSMNGRSKPRWSR